MCVSWCVCVCVWGCLRGCVCVCTVWYVVNAWLVNWSVSRFCFEVHRSACKQANASDLQPPQAQPSSSSPNQTKLHQQHNTQATQRAEQTILTRTELNPTNQHTHALSHTCTHVHAKPVQTDHDCKEGLTERVGRSTKHNAPRQNKPPVGLAG